MALKWHLKKNDFYHELVFYQETSKGMPKNEERERDYLKESMQRAFSTIKDLSLNNKWNFFLTLTVDPSKHDRMDYETVKQKLLKSLDNYRNRKDQNMKYILKAELHKDGSIHFHGLVYLENFEELNFNIKGSHAQRRRQANRNINVYDWKYFAERFGFTQLIKIYNRSEFVAYYMAKYITKDEERVFKHSYFRSKGLKKSQVIAEGQAQHIAPPMSPLGYYEGQFVTTYQLTPQQAQNWLKDNDL